MSRRVVIGLVIFLTFFVSFTGYSSPIGDEDKLSLESKIARLFIVKAVPSDLNSKTYLKREIIRHRPGGVYFDGGLMNEIGKLSRIFQKELDYELLTCKSLDLTEAGLPNENIIAGTNDKNLISECGTYTASAYSSIGVNMLITEKKLLDEEFYERLGLQGIMTVSSISDAPGINGSIFPFEPGYKNRRKYYYDSTELFQLRKGGFSNLALINLENIPDSIDYEEALIGAFNSTYDLFLFPENLKNSIEILKKAIKTGRVEKKELERKLRRIYTGRYYTPGMYSASMNREELYRKILTSSITLLKDDLGLLPLKVLDTMAVASLDIGQKGQVFETYLGHYTNIIQYEKLTDRNVERLKYYDLVFVYADKDLTTEEKKSLDEINIHTNVALVINPNKTNIKDYSAYPIIISAYSDNEIIQKLLPQKIFGSRKFNGRLFSQGYLGDGITTDTYDRLAFGSPEETGMNITTLAEIDSIADEAIRKGATPGCQVVVARKGKIVLNKAYGYHTYNKKKPVTPETVYDIASLTKVMSTLQTIMFMHEKNVIDLNEKLSTYLPELKGSNKEDMVIKDILLHQAGLRPFMPFWVQTMNDEELMPEFYSHSSDEHYPLQVSEGIYATETLKDSVWSWIIDSRLLRKRYSGPYRYRYSDVGFYMMQQLAERKLNQPLDEFMDQNYYDPLGMTSTSYLPLCNISKEKIPPTARDKFFRQQLISGIVHDEGAAMFGGVAGHAGLFSNALDLAKMGQMMLWQGKYGGIRFYKPETIELFTRKQEEENRRGLGWDKPDPRIDKGPTSNYASLQTFGHTGFTGTAVWIDPKEDLIFVFLSNRIHPDPDNSKLISLDIRSRMQDVLYKSISDYQSLNNLGINPGQ